MRTKILLTVAAALAAGLVSSNAQVYSANIVGYVNVVTPAGAPAAIENPLDAGNNSLTNVLANAPKGTVVSIWNGAGFTSASRALFGAGAWSAGAGTNMIPPGVGFFITTPEAYTNTFVGTVVPGVGATNSMALTGGSVYLVGSTLPVSGTITNSVDQGPNTLNLGSSMPKGTIISIWNGNGYTSYSRALFGAGNWSGNPTINVGESFFLTPGSNTNWVQSLQ